MTKSEYVAYLQNSVDNLTRTIESIEPFDYYGAKESVAMFTKYRTLAQTELDEVEDKPVLADYQGRHAALLALIWIR